MLPVDAFTCRPILDRTFAVEIAGGGCPVKKAEGFYVFRGVLPEHGQPGAAKENGELCVSLRGAGYQRRELRIPVSSVSRKNPLLTVRMEPDKDYPFPPGAVFLEGTLAADTAFLAAAERQGGGLSLTADCLAGDKTLSVYREMGQNLSGSRFYMTDKEKEAWISFGMPVVSGESTYRLHSAVTGSFSKTKTRLSFAFERAAAKKSEAYFAAFPLPGIMDKKTDVDIICRVKSDKGVEEYKFRTRPGETVRQDF